MKIFYESILLYSEGNARRKTQEIPENWKISQILSLFSKHEVCDSKKLPLK